MNSRVLNILIILCTNLCCTNSGIVSFVKSSSSTVSNWYDYYIKPLWITTPVQPFILQPDADIVTYEHEDGNHNPSDDIDDGNIVLMDFTDNQMEANIENDEDEDLEYYTYLSNYDNSFYDVMHQTKRSNEPSNSGIFYKFLKFFGYYPSTSSDDQNTFRPCSPSNQTNGLDVRLILLFKRIKNNKIVDSMERQLKFILPGTLWCGDGSLAESDDDLGLFHKTDQCCKTHDWCPKYIESGKKFMNLENIGAFTRSHCECDRLFYKCLKKANSIISNRIGETYFNVLQPQCFSKEFPIVGCIKRRFRWTESDKRCFKYVVDDSGNKTWQWFDNKKY